MLHIKPVYTSYEREEYSSACGFDYTTDQYCVAEFDNNNIIGTALYRVHEGYAEITDIGFVPQYDDNTARILLARGTLNAIDLSGIKTVVFSAQNTEFVKGLGFFPKYGKLALQLQGYFDEPCHKQKIEQK